MINKPQIDLPRDRLGFPLSGGADLWDEGAAGQLVTAEYFEIPAAINKFWKNIAGVWKQTTAFINKGPWKQLTPFINVNNTWK